MEVLRLDEKGTAVAVGDDEGSSGDDDEKEKSRWSSRTENFALRFFFVEGIGDTGLSSISSVVRILGISLRDGFVLLYPRCGRDDGFLLGRLWCASTGATDDATRTVNGDSDREGFIGWKICESDRELARERDPFLEGAGGGRCSEWSCCERICSCTPLKIPGMVSFEVQSSFTWVLCEALPTFLIDRKAWVARALSVLERLAFVLSSRSVRASLTRFTFTTSMTSEYLCLA